MNEEIQQLVDEFRAAPRGSEQKEAKLRAVLDKMEMREITQNAPEQVLQTLVDKEAVHGMLDIDELKTNRLAPEQVDSYYNKHAYGLYVPGEDKPSCVVYTEHNEKGCDTARKLLGHRLLPGQIEDMVDQAGKVMQNPARYIMFYSISNIAEDLSGIPLGRELILRVAQQLDRDYPGHPDFSTLSPLRSFPTWLYHALEDQENALFDEQTIQWCLDLTNTTPCCWLKDIMPLETVIDNDARGRVIEVAKPVSFTPPELNSQEQRLFDDLRTKLALKYVAETDHKQAGKVDESQSFEGLHRLKRADGVAKFHLGNGSLLGNIAIQKDPKEWRDAAGVMVNYVYGPYREKNMQVFAENGVVHYDGLLKVRYPNTVQNDVNNRPVKAIESATSFAARSRDEGNEGYAR